MRFGLIPALISVALLVSCATHSDRDYFNNRDCNFYGASFCVALIGESAFISNGPDFVIYNFHWDEQTVLAIYEGDYAQEFGDETTEPMAVGSMTIAYREFDDGETFHRYYYNSHIDRPHQLHMMSPSNLSERHKHFVEEVLKSLRYCRPSGASMICDNTR